MLASIGTWWNDLLALSVKTEQLGFGQMTARAASICVAPIVIVRSGKMRALGGGTVFDVILAITIGSIRRSMCLPRAASTRRPWAC